MNYDPVIGSKVRRWAIHTNTPHGVIHHTEYSYMSGERGFIDELIANGLEHEGMYIMPAAILCARVESEECVAQDAVQS